MTDLIPYDLSASVADATGDIGKRSKPVYEHDARVLAQWMIDRDLTPLTFTRSHAMQYLSWLKGQHAGATVKRMISVARNIFLEQVTNEQRTSNPFTGIKSPKADNETPYMALSKQQAKDLLASVDQSSHIGKRDYALISLLLRTGIRRQECVDLNLEDIKKQDEHNIATVRHGKGDKRRNVKIPVDVFRSIQAYIEDAGRQNNAPSDPLFIGYDRWDRAQEKRISTKLVERTVFRYAAKIGITKLTPHGLRASFATLSMEGGAKLMQIQYAMGHDDPKTTERYLKRKENLDHNAVDFIDLD